MESVNYRDAGLQEIPVAAAPVAGTRILLQGEERPPALFGLAGDDRIRRMLGALPAAGFAADGESLLILRRDCVYSRSLLDWLAAAPGRAVSDGEARAIHVRPDALEAARRWLDGDGPPPDHVQVVAPVAIGPGYSERLRKRETPWCLRVDATSAPEAERRLYGASYKGVTDAITKYLWPEPAFHATRLCARLGLSPNMVTGFSAVFVLLAFWLFWRGDFLPGLLAAFAMTFLDTVDGKLARVTLTSSPFGNAFDHGIDLIHPPFWYWAWAVGLSSPTLQGPGWLRPALAVIAVGYVLGRLFEGWFIARHGFEMHVWRRFDSRFRLIVARRNPNLVLLLAFSVIGRPDWGFLAVALWTAVSLIVHPIQIIAAEVARARSGRLRSWLDRAARV